MAIYTFPKNFLWGSATSSHQVEGNNRLNDWWDWEEKGKVKTRSLDACQHYERFEQDFDLTRQLHHNAHRFSIEWSRLEPERGNWNQKEFDHYHRVIDALISRGIEPVVTLHHFTNPMWLAREDGWANPKIVEYFGMFAQKVAEAYGSKVKYWVTINEPLVYLYHGYVSGLWPPGEHQPRKMVRVFRHLLLAHIQAYQAIHERIRAKGFQKPMVGIAKHMVVFSPCNPGSWKDRLTTTIRHIFFNHLFLRALQSGFLMFPGIFFETLPARRTMDFIGINYYTRDFIRFGGWQYPGFVGDICSAKHHQLTKERNDMGWEIYPKGLFDLLLELRRYQVPVMITENGVCTEDDAKRKEFIHRHLVEVAHAIEKRIPVMGYLYWSLLDNFEWADGYRPRFGMVHVDYETQKRQPKESALYFSELAKNNSINMNF